MLKSRSVSVSKLTALIAILCCFSLAEAAFADANEPETSVVQFPPEVKEYSDEGEPLWERLCGRIEV
jgi:hypothetical protein